MVQETLNKDISFDADPELAVCQGAVCLRIVQQKEDIPARNEEAKTKEDVPNIFGNPDIKFDEYDIKQDQTESDTDEAWKFIQKMKNDKARRDELERRKIDDLVRRADERWQKYDKHENNTMKIITSNSKDEARLQRTIAAEWPEHMKELMIDVISGFNACDGEWIYYTENDDTNHNYGLYKVRINGTGKTMLCSRGSRLGIHVRSDSVWVYYQVKSNYKDRGEIYRIRKDGRRETRICGEPTYHYNLKFNLSGGWIYFSDGDIHLKKMRTDGLYITSLISDMYPHEVTVGKDWVYYKSLDNRLSRINTDGAVQENILKTNFNINQIYVYGNWIYYVTKNIVENGDKKADIFDLWRVCADGTGNRMVVSNFCKGNARIIGSWIYYNNMNREPFRMMPDGTNIQRVSFEMMKQTLSAMKDVQ